MAHPAWTVDNTGFSKKRIESDGEDCCRFAKLELGGFGDYYVRAVG